MSTTDRHPDGAAADHDAPEVTLEWLCDEHGDCEELTVFDPEAEDPTTHWLSVDVETAVALEEIR